MSDWRTRAACRAPEVDQALFFPPPLEIGQNWDTTEAKAVCATCPVRRPCLVDAFELDEHHGVRGGVNMASRDDRRAARAVLDAGGAIMPGRHCEECGEHFIAALNQRLCSASCRARRSRRVEREKKAARRQNREAQREQAS